MKRVRGFSLIEVLVTILLMVLGLLGVAGMQAKSSSLEMESYQRSEALALVNDMASRLQSATMSDASVYITTGLTPAYLGTGDANAVTDCTTLTDVARSKCEWSNALKGAAETIGGTTRVGAMIGARGCVKQVRAAVVDPATTPHTCIGGLYEVTVVWQGMSQTAAPGVSNTCGSGAFGDEKLRRSVTLPVGAGTAGCV
jgi:type IV pilus assembly protein PilV